MQAWGNFFVGELGAAAALAGLLFVSVSMNQARILELGRMSDRGIETLLMLFLVMAAASLSLMPGQPMRLLGGEILVVSLVILAATIALQRAYLRHMRPEHRRRAGRMVWFNRLAVVVVALSGLAVLWRGDTAGLYALGAGILMSFVAAGVSAWVLLVEISR